MLGHDIVWTLSEALPANWHQQSVGNDLVYSSAIGSSAIIMTTRYLCQSNGRFRNTMTPMLYSVPPYSCPELDLMKDNVLKGLYCSRHAEYL